MGKNLEEKISIVTEKAGFIIGVIYGATSLVESDSHPYIKLGLILGYSASGFLIGKAAPHAIGDAFRYISKNRKN